MKDDWYIPETNCHLLIRDNAANIRLGAELSNFNSESCFIHTLQLTLNDGIFHKEWLETLLATAERLLVILIIHP